MKRVLLHMLTGLLVWTAFTPVFGSTDARARGFESPDALVGAAALLISPSVIGSGAAPMEKFVLQVGINDYLHVPTLKGCLADVENMRKVLTTKFSVPPDHIMTLPEEKATHEGIVAAFRSQLIEKAKQHRDALVIFQYSGHGSRVPDQNGDKADHMDSTIVPVDSRDLAGKHFDIVDDEIRELFNELSRYTTNVLFIFDCCHSGNPTRGEQTREIPMDTRPQPKEKPFVADTSAGQTRGQELRGQDLIGLLPRDERYISIAAALPNELANETYVGNHKEGVLTHFLVDALKHVKPETTYRDLMVTVANKVNTECGAQHPQVEGDLGRPVLAGSANREDPFIKISDVTGNFLTVDAGAAQGMTEGTILSLYAPDAHVLSGADKRLGSAKVVKVGDLASTAELLQPVPVPTNAKVVVLSRDFGSTRTRLLLFPTGLRGSNATPESKVTSDVAELLAADKAVELVWFKPNDSDGSVPPADAAVMRGRFGSVFKDKTSLAPGADGKIHPPADDAEIFYLTGLDRTLPLFGFAAKVEDPLAPQRIADAVEHLANQRALRLVNNEASKLNGQIVLKVIRVIGERDDQGFLKPGSKDEPVELGKMDQDYHFDQGEMFKFQIENHSPRDLYVNLFDISTDGSIQILYPPSGAAGVRINSRDSQAFIIPQAFSTTGPAGQEIFKIIATTVSKSHDDFAFLEQGAVRGVRVVPVSVQELPDWTTAQISFVISGRVKE
jgi:hypothetical protein